MVLTNLWKDDFIIPKIECCKGFYGLREIKGLVVGRGIGGWGGRADGVGC